MIKLLAKDLTARFGRGFRRSNLYHIRAFYLAYREKVQTASGLLTQRRADSKKTVSPETDRARLTAVAQAFALPWSHYSRLLTVENAHARGFYETEAMRGGWSWRQLDRQIASQLYERTALSRNKAAMLPKGARTVAAEYKLALPDESILAEELDRTRRMLDARPR